MADAVETAGQHMQQEAAHELVWLRVMVLWRLWPLAR